MENNVDEMRVRVGQRIRHERSRRRLTIDQLASASDLTKGFISQVERGETAASLASLTRLASALDMELSQLFEPHSQFSGVLRGDDRSPVYLGGEGVADFQLTPSDERRVQLVEAHVDPKGNQGTELWSLHGEVVVVHVLTGQLEIRFEEGPVILEAGDTMTFSAGSPRTWQNPSDTEAANVLFFLAPAVY